MTSPIASPQWAEPILKGAWGAPERAVEGLLGGWSTQISTLNTLSRTIPGKDGEELLAPATLSGFP